MIEPTIFTDYNGDPMLATPAQIQRLMRDMGMPVALPPKGRASESDDPVKAERRRCLGILEYYWIHCAAEGDDDSAELLADIAAEIRGPEHDSEQQQNAARELIGRAEFAAAAGIEAQA